jgi:hypothetical protein
MAGGLMQLVAYGAQDIYLTGNPQITFFKVVYRRHTNFAVEAIEQTFNGAADLGRRFTCTIARNGDLLHRLYLQVDVSSNSSSANNAFLGFQLLDYVEVEIGGQVIDKQYGEWMAVWCDLTHTLDQALMLSQMLDGQTANTQPLSDRLHIPLQFWFCRNPGLALPLIALQYHEVKINVQFVSSVAGLAVVSSGSYFNSCTVWADYIFLDTDERRRFAQVSHEYLIEQVQYSNALTIASQATTTQHELRFNHPIKELVWLVDTDTAGSTSSYTTYSPCLDALLQLNGQDRFKRRSGDYFTRVQRYEHHTGAGRGVVCGGLTPAAGLNTIPFGASTVLPATHIYSFALKPEEHQPSGTCNFSRIDNAVLNLSFSGTAGQPSNLTGSAILKVYAVNYNVLRIMSGMGGLAYSN